MSMIDTIEIDGILYQLTAVEGGSIRYDVEQNLTPAQQEQARNNIGAGTGGGGGGSNLNLLDNPWFTINQLQLPKASVDTKIPTGIKLDRWSWSPGMINSDNYAYQYDENGLTIAQLKKRISRVYISQYIQPGLANILDGKKLTLSVLNKYGQIISGIFTYTKDMSSTTVFTKYQTSSGNDDTRLDAVFYKPDTSEVGHSGEVRLQYGSSSSSALLTRNAYTFKAAKLEIGEVSTLDLDLPPNYSDELAKCRRYMRVFSLYADANTQPTFMLRRIDATQRLAVGVPDISVMYGSSHSIQTIPNCKFKNLVDGTVHDLSLDVLYRTADDGMKYLYLQANSLLDGVGDVGLVWSEDESAKKIRFASNF